MPYIRSANQSRFDPLLKPGPETYSHGAERRSGYIPLAFQITSPYDNATSLLPHALISHVNPQSFAETFNKKVERIQTRGGFVEQHWGDDLGEISVDQSTGAFINLYTGLSSILRHRTIAWDRYQDLYDLFRNNGSVYDPHGNIVLQGHVLLMYDRGTYLGHFRTFSMEESEETPFAFKVSWTFKVVETLFQVPQNALQVPVRPAAFQAKNQLPTDAGSTNYQVTARTEAERKAGEKSERANQELLNRAQSIQAEAQSSTVQAAAQGAAQTFQSVSSFISGSTIPTKEPTPVGTPVKPVKR